jgi:hypothetical protein
MKLSDMPTNALLRLYRSTRRKHSDCYGVDARTSKLTAPDALRVLREIASVVNGRECEWEIPAF